jgi:hypothetical protein
MIQPEQVRFGAANLRVRTQSDARNLPRHGIDGRSRTGQHPHRTLSDRRRRRRA